MSATEVIDLSALQAALDAPAPESPDLAPVDVTAPETVEVKAVPEPVEKKVETEKPDEKKTEEAKAENKPENAVRAELKTKAPSVLAKSVHEALKEFMAENKATPQGVAKLVAINDAVAALHSQVAEYKSAAADVNSVSSAARELQETVEQFDQLVYGSADPEKTSELAENIHSDCLENSTPEAFVGITEAMFSKMEKEHPAEFYQHVLKNYSHALEQTGVLDATRNLIRAFNQNDTKAMH